MFSASSLQNDVEQGNKYKKRVKCVKFKSKSFGCNLSGEDHNAKLTNDDFTILFLLLYYLVEFSSIVICNNCNIN